MPVEHVENIYQSTDEEQRKSAFYRLLLEYLKGKQQDERR